MRLKTLHRVLGLVMLLPLFLWAATGLVFLTKPGYPAAYEQLSPKFYPLDQPIQLTYPDQWTELRLLRTILGYHLLVLEKDGWQHRDPVTLGLKSPPSQQEIKALVQDAIRFNAARYGGITAIDGATVVTDKQIDITLDWDTLSLRQEGSDTRLLDTLYKIHYLQWSDSPVWNKFLGFSGIVLLATLTLLGLIVFVGARDRSPHEEA